MARSRILLLGPDGLAATLHAAGLAPERAATPHTLLAALAETGDIALVIADDRTPGLDLLALRQRLDTDGVALLVCSEHANAPGTLRLPVPDADLLAAVQHHLRHTRATLSDGGRVLLNTAEAGRADAWREVLELEGLEVVVAADIPASCRALTDQRPDLLLVDGAAAAVAMHDYMQRFGLAVPLAVLGPVTPFGGSALPPDPPIARPTLDRLLAMMNGTADRPDPDAPA